MDDRSGGTRLYTPGLLALAVELADYPMHAALDRRSTARSRSCGSQLTVGCAIDEAGTIEAIGLEVTACAVGQAAAAIFARAATGRTAGGLAVSLATIEHWLANGDSLPAWPRLDALIAAREYPARHGAILLPWKAAVEALSNPPAPR